MFDNPIILIIIAAAALLRWFLQRSQAENDEEPKRPEVPGLPVARSGETQTEEERIRRFLEALGQPPTSTPPQRVTPKRKVVETFKRLSESTLPPLVTVPPPLPSAPSATTPPPPPPPAFPSVQDRVFRPAPPPEFGFEVRDVGAPTSSESFSDAGRAKAAAPGLRFALASRQGLRSAIILREVFGPPRGLQPFDLVGGH